ncbi:MAG: tetratricopeptide repeat protein [Elusimicrobia bacterium]|nr:tetratricopeptide repeat protein [Elusimicrobiota bacterium]
MSSYTSEEYEDKGLGLLRAGRPAEALAAFEEGERRFPGDADLLMGTAMARRDLGDAEGARVVLEGLRRTRTAGGEVGLALVETYLDLGRMPEALEAARESAGRGTDAPQLNRLARAFYSRRFYREAFPLYERAAEAAPEWSEAWFGLGACQWALRQPAAAEAALRRAVELAPEDWQARQFLGCVLCDQGRRVEAKAMLESVPLDASWQKPALERLVALSWWPSDAERSRALEVLWRRVVGGAPPVGALEALAEASRKMEETPR